MTFPNFIVDVQVPPFSLHRSILFKVLNLLNHPILSFINDSVLSCLNDLS